MLLVYVVNSGLKDEAVLMPDPDYPASRPPVTERPGNLPDQGPGAVGYWINIVGQRIYRYMYKLTGQSSSYRMRKSLISPTPNWLWQKLGVAKLLYHNL
jgi:hypothetical protein